MASELIVQTIQGPSSGANANKVIIPSGHTLDASGGTLVPSAGQVVQEICKKITVNTYFSSSGYTDANDFDINITPKYANSIIAIGVWAKTGLNNSSLQAAQDHRLLRDGTSTVHSSSWQNYFNQNQVATDIYPPLDFIVFDEPNTTSQVNYKLQGRIYSGTLGAWGFDANGGTTVHSMWLKEIKQ